MSDEKRQTLPMDIALSSKSALKIHELEVDLACKSIQILTCEQSFLTFIKQKENLHARIKYLRAMFEKIKMVGVDDVSAAHAIADEALLADKETVSDL